MKIEGDDIMSERLRDGCGFLVFVLIDLLICIAVIVH